jgi:hypothetical protein
MSGKANATMHKTLALGAALAAALLGSGGNARAAVSVPAQADVAPEQLREFHGTVLAVRGTTLYLRLRTGRTLVVDAREPLALHRSVLLTPTRPVLARGTLGADGVLHASVIVKSVGHPEDWPADR